MDGDLVEKLLAAAGLMACAAWLVRMMLAPAQRQRIAALARRLGHWPARFAKWPARRRSARDEAARAIERARLGREVQRSGNVYRPKAWEDDSKPPTLH